MNRFLKKAICLFLCLLTVAGCLSACGKKKDQETDTNDTEDLGAQYNTDSNGYIMDSITQTFGETEIKILSWSEKRNFIFPKTSSTSDTVSATIYARNVALERRLKITLKEDFESGEWSNYTAFITQARLANEVGYDIICSYSLWPAVLAQEGALQNLRNLAYPEFDMPWWPESVKEWEQNGSLFFCADNSSALVIKSMEVCFANLNLIDQRGLENPIQLVLNKGWTIERLIEYATAFGNEYDMNNPQAIYGLVVDEMSRLDAFFYGAGFHSTVNNNDGLAELTLSSPDTVDRITSYVGQLGQLFRYEWTTILSNSVQPMKNNQTAFEVVALGNITQLSELNYAPLPMPMLNSEQENYCTISHNSYDVWCIPTSAADPEVSAVVIEAFASSDYRTIAPFFYETYLKKRYSVNDDGAAVFDIIRNSVVYDFGRVATKVIGTCESSFRYCFWDPETDTPLYTDSYATLLSKRVGSLSIKLEDLLTMYKIFSDQ